MPKIYYRWLSIVANKGFPFEFTDNAVNPTRHLPQKPSVYRWAIYEGNTLRKVYIGETDNLRRRVNQYFSPGPTQATNLRLNAVFKKDIEAGLRIRLEVLHIDPTYLNNLYLCDGNLSDQYIRKMMENLTLADSDVTQYRILNATENPLERRKRKAMKDSPLETFSQEHGLTE